MPGKSPHPPRNSSTGRDTGCAFSLYTSSNRDNNNKLPGGDIHRGIDWIDSHPEGHSVVNTEKSQISLIVR